MSEERFVSGFAAIVGRPNVGKSTLLNALVGKKVAITSDKPQTTRNRIVGVTNRPGAQLVFVDTPGIHKPHHRLGDYMVRVAQSAIPGVDVVLFVVDGTDPPGEGDRYVADLIKKSGQRVVLVVNKVDLLPKEQWYQAMDLYRGLLDAWLDIVPVSALAKKNLAALVDLITAQLQPGPRYYPEEMITDQPERFVIAELVREQILALTREEIPHSVAVEVEALQPRPNGVVYVAAAILVERDSQKGILIGAGGRMLREVGSRARQEVEGLLGSKTFLELFVKVKKDWRNRDSVLKALGYQSDG